MSKRVGKQYNMSKQVGKQYNMSKQVGKQYNRWANSITGGQTV